MADGLRCIDNGSPPFLSIDAPVKHLKTCLRRLEANYPPDSRIELDRQSLTAGLFAGPTLVAYLFFRLSTGDPASAQHYRGLAKQYLHRSHGSHSLRLDPCHCGVASEFLAWHAMQIMLAATEQASSPRPDDPTPAHAAEAPDAAALAAPLDDLLWPIKADTLDPAASDEWLYGRAGYLALLGSVHRYLPRHGRAALRITAARQKLARQILARAPGDAPWTWHGKHYLGAVHGDAGILTQLVQADPALAPALEPRVAALLDAQDAAGNWPSSLPLDAKPGSAPSATHNRLVQVCHGAPGIMASLVALRPHFPGLAARLDAAVARGRACVFARGALVKESCLCHGIAGNALALAPGSAEREHLLALATPERLAAGGMVGLGEERRAWERSSDAAGLWFGEAGRAWAWGVLAGWLPEGLPGYAEG